MKTILAMLIVAAALLTACSGEPDRCGLAQQKHGVECAGVPPKMEPAK